MSEEEQEGRKANGPSISVTLKGSSLDRRDIMDRRQYGLELSQDVPGFPKKVFMGGMNSAPLCILRRPF